MAYHCSSPSCGKPTTGLNQAGDKAINIGVAAHITAAAPEGPRYDDSLTPAERSHQNNGIWLCANCSKIIDSDVAEYSVQVLRDWKKQAEKNTRLSVLRSNDRSAISKVPVPLDEEDEQKIAALQLLQQDTLESVLTRLNFAGQQDIEAFRRRAPWPAHAVDLTLYTRSEGKNVAVTVQGVANLVEVVRTLSIISAPGTGKTTTLNQLASALNEKGLYSAILAPLAEWSAQPESLLVWLTRRSAYHEFSPKHFMLLAVHGKLVLLLDGWNELDSLSRTRLLHEIEAFQRDYPLISLVVSTRQQSHDSPLAGPVIHLGALTPSQQFEIARATRGEDALALLDHARRTPGVRDLIAIPLYLNALLSNASNDRMPRTKEEVLRLFVERHEVVPLKAEILHRELLGFQRRFLQALAVEATAKATTVINATRARAAVNRVQKELVEEEQIASPLQPPAILNALVNHVSLIRGPEDTFSFHHSQFQEWHASFEVERLVSALPGDAAVAKRLVRDILNQPAWEESVLFACERMSESGHAEGVVWLIRQTLAIDPLFAAEMIYRSAGQVWEMVKNEVLSFTERWHTPGRLDRAVRFMTSSGRPEFADVLWPLLIDPDPQVYLASFRSGRRFRPSVLGADASTRMAALSSETRSHLLCEIASEGGIEGLELATKIARNDSSLEVKQSLLGTLVFRRADRQVADLLSLNSPDLWRAYAALLAPEEVSDPQVAQRLRNERKERMAAETDPAIKIFMLLEQRPLPESVAGEIAQILRDADFLHNDDRLRRAISRAYEAFPKATEDALAERLRNGKLVHFLFDDIAPICATVEDESLGRMLLEPNTDRNSANAIARIIGPITVGKLIDGFASSAWVRQPANSPPQYRSKDCVRIGDRIAKTRQNSLLQAVSSRAETRNPEVISALTEVIARHGSPLNPEPLDRDIESIAALVKHFPAWADALIGDLHVSRERLSFIARAITRIPHADLLSTLLRVYEEDIRRHNAAIAESFVGGRRQPLNPEAITSWSLQYNQAFIAIGDDQVVEAMTSRLALTKEGVDAARVLRNIWAKDNKEKRATRHTAWPDFSEVVRVRSDGRPSDDTISNSFSSAIFDHLRSLDLKSATETEQQHAVDLGALALSMPSQNDSSIIGDLLALPLATSKKHFFIQELVLSGRVVSADVLLGAAREIAAAAEKQPWLLDHTQGTLDRWLEFFPFSDQPDALFTAMDEFTPDVLESWRFHGVVAAICFAPLLDKEALLRKLAERDPRFYRDDEWLDSLFWCSTSATHTRILDDLVEGRLPSAGHSWRLVRELASTVKAEASFRAEIYRRLDGPLPASVRSILLRVIAQAPDTEGIFHLLRTNVAEGRALDGNLQQAVEEVVLVKEFLSPSQSAFQFRSVDATLLRRRLFDLAGDSGAEARLVAQCLELIDEIRDDNGQVDTEPRHPDIASGRPWPIISPAPPGATIESDSTEITTGTKT